MAAFIALIGAAEALIWYYRLSVVNQDRAYHVALSTLLVCVTRVAFVSAGVSSVIAGDVLVNGTVYCVSAAVFSGAVHYIVKRK